MTFSVDGKDSEFTSYIIRSNKFPQQTSLLGMLRFLILRYSDKQVFANNKIQDPNKATDCIGKQSFMFDKNHKRVSFGYIEEISNCFVMDGENAISVIAKGNEYDFTISKSSQGTANEFTFQIPSSNYDAKEGFKDQFKNVFKEDWRIGIDKDYSGRTKNASLFKQVAYQFVKEDKDKDGNILATHDYKFALYASVDEKFDLTKCDGEIVSIGADSSQFVINVVSKEYVETGVTCKFSNVVVLSSPAYIEIKQDDSIAFAITETISFKFMQTTVNTSDYGRLGNQIKHSDRIDLYQRGSVFFFNSKDDAEKFGKKIDSYADFRQIGYNYYQVK